MHENEQSYRPCMRMDNSPMREDEPTMGRMAQWREWRVPWNDGGGCFPFQREGQPTGGVCVWERTDSPATLHSHP